MSINNWKDVDGWFDDNDASRYNSIVERYSFGNFVEVGVWKGRSFASVIQNLLKNQYKNIYAVDHWLGSSTELNTTHAEALTTDLFAVFTNNMSQLGVENTYTALRMDSVEASKQFDDECFDVIFIDGDHEYEPFKQDLIHWYPKLKVGGTICGHDGLYPPILTALNEMFGENHTVNGVIWEHIK